jgi:hypothetical protein
LRSIDRLGPIGLLLLWTATTAAWLALYGFSFDLRDVLLATRAAGLRIALAGIATTLVVVPILLLVLTFRWLNSAGLARRVGAWHLGQVGATWFVGGFLAVFVSLGFRDLGAGGQAPGLLYLLFFLGFSSLAVPSFLTLRWLAASEDAGRDR